MSENSVLVKMIIRLVFVYSLLAIFLFGTAGTLNWPEAWLLLAILMTFSIFAVSWFLRKSPGLLESRAQVKPPEDYNRVVAITGIVMVILYLFIPGYDVGQAHWSVVPVELKIIAFILLILGLVIAFLVMNENPYASKEVEVQEKQTVITTGLYQYVRHPLYTGSILFLLDIPLALGSYVALLPAIILVFLLIVRIPGEEEALEKELKGYKDYKEKVRYRLIPKIY